MTKISYVAAMALLAAFVNSQASEKISEGFTAGADQVRIHYWYAGSDEARHTLLLIPGWRISASIWSKQLAYFSNHGYRVIAMDSRSQAGSSVTQSGNAPENRAADIDRVIAGLHLKHVDLVGWSQGAQDVVAYVDRFGTGAVESLALIDSPVSAGPEDVTESAPFVKIILRGIGLYSRSPRAYSDGMMHAIISAPASPELFKHLDDESLKTPVDIGISMLIQDLFVTDRRPALKKFDKPTLVMASGQSPLLDAQRQMATLLPHGNFVTIDHAAHALFFDQPDEFNQKLADFVSAVDSSVTASPSA
jgi:non-heme chloroperoxidase